MNMRIDENNEFSKSWESLIKPKYSDFSADWYKTVGTVIIFTMMVNVLATPMIVFVFHVMRLIKVCFDQSTYFSKKKK